MFDFCRSLVIILAGKSLVINATSSGARVQVMNALRDLSDSVARMQQKLTSMPSGINDCDKCIRNIENALMRLQDPSLALLDATYTDCFEGVLSESRV